MKRIAAVGLVMALSCSKPPPPPAPAASPSGVAKNVLIASGTAYTSDRYLIPGHVVILEFYADW